jgi:hypothetical protein
VITEGSCSGRPVSASFSSAACLNTTRAAGPNPLAGPSSILTDAAWDFG